MRRDHLVSHDEYVFVYRRERVKNIAEEPVMPYDRIDTMNNTGYQAARAAAGLGGVRIHVAEFLHRDSTCSHRVAATPNPRAIASRPQQRRLSATAARPMVVADRPSGDTDRLEVAAPKPTPGPPAAANVRRFAPGPGNAGSPGASATPTFICFSVIKQADSCRPW
jgi:hypothetical protein